MSTHRGRKKAVHEEEHENHERWLVSYADMMTLLMALFIVMFAISQVDQKKFAELSGGLAAGFGAPLSVLPASSGVLDESGVLPVAVDLAPTSLPPPEAPAPTAAASTGETTPTQPAGPAVDVQTEAEVRAEAAAEAADLRALKEQILQALAAKGLEGAVRFRIDERGLVISIVTDEVLFPSDRAELQPQGQAVLDALSPVMNALSNVLAVEGHTNQAPVKPKYYASDWDLSAARATSVVRYLNEVDGIPTTRLYAAGYGNTRPLWPIDDATGRAVNKRVEIVVVSDASALARGLVPLIAPDLTDAVGPRRS